MADDRWQPVEDWWSSHDHHHLFPYKMPQNNASSGGTSGGGGGGSYGAAQPPAAHWWYPNQPAPLHIPQPVSRGAMPRQVKSDVKPRGRMTAYAYFVQMCREEHKKKHPDEHVVFADFSRMCAERWKSMTDKDKKRFHDLADKDKQRYETEMKDYTPSENDKRKSKKRKKKDPNAPKRPLTAFFLFSNVERSKVKEVNPEYTAGDTSKELGRRWSEIDPSVKGKYQELADKEKARYDKEMSEYKLKGKFTSQVKKDEEDDSAEDEDDDDVQ
ncbi:HMG (high mobility group) box [Nesidiocoris tenuis]|uniref:HMG (High mobility group) box n=1 Tax=Nesidiocoris tenuis TaxID=355587 RepID=A0ABN7ACG8_9HEMI|nr:HMG (high mobility group) box [Nesidiocoris tenuis]